MLRTLTWFGIFVAVVIGGYFVVGMILDNRLDKEIKTTLGRAKKDVAIHYEKAHYDVIGRNSTILGVEVSRLKDNRRIRMEKVVLHRVNDLFPKSAHFSAEGVEIEHLQDIPVIAERFESLGIDQTPLEIELDYVYTFAKKRLEIKKLRIGAPNLGYIDLTTTLSDFDTKRYDLSADLNPIAFLAFSLSEAEIKFEDAGIGPRYVEQEARAAGVSMEGWAKAQGRAFGEAYKAEDHEYNALLATGLTNFLDSPSALTIKASPSKPVSLSEIIFTKPEQVPELLGIRISD